MNGRSIMKRHLILLTLLAASVGLQAEHTQAQVPTTVKAVLMHSKHCGYCKMLISNLESIQKALLEKNYQLNIEQFDVSELKDPSKAVDIKERLSAYTFQNQGLNGVPTLILVDQSNTERHGDFGCRVTGYSESTAYANNLLKRIPSCTH